MNIYFSKLVFALFFLAAVSGFSSDEQPPQEIRITLLNPGTKECRASFTHKRKRVEKEILQDEPATKKLKTTDEEKKSVQAMSFEEPANKNKIDALISVLENLQNQDVDSIQNAIFEHSSGLATYEKLACLLHAGFTDKEQLKKILSLFKDKSLTNGLYEATKQKLITEVQRERVRNKVGNSVISKLQNLVKVKADKSEMLELFPGDEEAKEKRLKQALQRGLYETKTREPLWGHEGLVYLEMGFTGKSKGKSADTRLKIMAFLIGALDGKEKSGGKLAEDFNNFAGTSITRQYFCDQAQKLCDDKKFKKHLKYEAVNNFYNSCMGRK